MISTPCTFVTRDRRLLNCETPKFEETRYLLSFRFVNLTEQGVWGRVIEFIPPSVYLASGVSHADGGVLGR